MVFYIFSKFEEPVKVFSVGHFFVWEKKKGEKYLYRIDNVDFLNFSVSGTLGANSKTGDQEITDLIPESEIMYGFFVGVRGPVRVYARQPLTISRWGVGAIPGYITQEISPYENPNPATFTVTFEDTRFAINVENPTNETVNYKIRFVGYKYKITELAKVVSVDPDTGAIRYEKIEQSFPSAVIQEMLRLWIRGKLPEVVTTGISAVR